MLCVHFLTNSILPFEWNSINIPKCVFNSKQYFFYFLSSRFCNSLTSSGRCISHLFSIFINKKEAFSFSRLHLHLNTQTHVQAMEEKKKHNVNWIMVISANITDWRHSLSRHTYMHDSTNFGSINREKLFPFAIQSKALARMC